MYRILSALTLTLGTIALCVGVLITKQPTADGNAVIAEKPNGVIMGGQAATLLPSDMTAKQHQVLNMAYAQAKSDGHRNPELVQSVLLQETHAGGIKKYAVAGNKGNEYYGLGQLKVEAARDVLAKWPDLWDKYKFQTRTSQEIIAHLILNPAFNIEMTSKYLKLLHERYGFTGRQLMNAYNRGPGGVREVDDNFHYAIGAEQKLAAAKRQGKL